MTPVRTFWIASIGISLVAAVAGFRMGNASRSPTHIAYLHYALGIVFVLLVVAGTFSQSDRVRRRNEIDWVSWFHMILFAALVYLSFSAMSYHYRKMNNNLNGGGTISSNNGTVVATYKGKSVDLTPYVGKHPGGEIIKRAHGRDLEEVWKEINVGWHASSPKVKKQLDKLMH